jgi:hypothetical protein
MMEKLAQDCEGGGARPPLFTIVTNTYKVAVYAPAEWADTLILFHLDQYMYSVSFPQLMDFTPPSTFALLRKSGLKPVCNVNIVYGKPQV